MKQHQRFYQPRRRINFRSQQKLRKHTRRINWNGRIHLKAWDVPMHVLARTDKGRSWSDWFWEYVDHKCLRRP